MLCAASIPHPLQCRHKRLTGMPYYTQFARVPRHLGRRLGEGLPAPRTSQTMIKRGAPPILVQRARAREQHVARLRRRRPERRRRQRLLNRVPLPGPQRLHARAPLRLLPLPRDPGTRGLRTRRLAQRLAPHGRERARQHHERLGPLRHARQKRRDHGRAARAAPGRPRAPAPPARSAAARPAACAARRAAPRAARRCPRSRAATAGSPAPLERGLVVRAEGPASRPSSATTPRSTRSSSAPSASTVGRPRVPSGSPKSSVLSMRAREQRTQVLGVDALHTKDVRQTHRLLVQHLAHIREIALFSRCKLVFIFECAHAHAHPHPNPHPNPNPNPNPDACPRQIQSRLRVAAPAARRRGGGHQELGLALRGPAGHARVADHGRAQGARVPVPPFLSRAHCALRVCVRSNKCACSCARRCRWARSPSRSTSSRPSSPSPRPRCASATSSRATAWSPRRPRPPLARRARPNHARSYRSTLTLPHAHTPSPTRTQVRTTYTGKLYGKQDDLCIAIQLALIGCQRFFQEPRYRNFRANDYLTPNGLCGIGA